MVDHTGPARRVLVTGSRTWTDTTIIRDALADVWHPDTVLVTGACPQGADLLAEQCWTHWGGRVERWPADWSGPCAADCPPGHRRPRRRDGSWYCPRAGHRRNQAMVDSRPDVCLAFIRNASPGASHCAGAARRAGVPVRPYTATSPRSQEASTR
jgi:hypothetical protein